MRISNELVMTKELMCMAPQGIEETDGQDQREPRKWGPEYTAHHGEGLKERQWGEW